MNINDLINKMFKTRKKDIKVWDTESHNSWGDNFELLNNVDKRGFHTFARWGNKIIGEGDKIVHKKLTYEVKEVEHCWNTDDMSFVRVKLLKVNQ